MMDKFWIKSDKILLFGPEVVRADQTLDLGAPPSSEQKKITERTRLEPSTSLSVVIFEGNVWSINFFGHFRAKEVTFWKLTHLKTSKILMQKT